MNSIYNNNCNDSLKRQQNKKLDTACKCFENIDTYSALANNYVIALDAYKKEKIKYDEELKKLDDWKNKKGEYKTYQTEYDNLINDVKTWQNCTSILVAGYGGATQSQRDNSCVWALGDGWVGTFVGDYWNTSEGCVPTFIKGYCKRTPAKAESDLNNSGYLNAKPSVRMIPKIPIPPTSNISCCTYNISEIDAGINNSTKNCITKLQTQILISDALGGGDSSSDDQSTLPLPTYNETIFETILETIKTNINLIIIIISIIFVFIIYSLY